MKGPSLVVGVVASVALGCAAGFALGRVASAPVSSQSPASASESMVEARPHDPGNASTVLAAAPAETERRSLNDEFARIGAIKSEYERAYEADLLMDRLSPAEIPGALEIAKSLPSGAQRGRMLSALFSRWGQLDGPAAVDALASLIPRDRRACEPAVFAAWAKMNPEAALARARGVASDNPMSMISVNAVLRTIAKTDPARAFSETNAFANFSLRRSSRSGVVSAASDAGRLAELVDSITGADASASESKEREEWITEVFKVWGGVDTDAPARALDAITDPELARSAMTGMLSGWAEQDPSYPQLALEVAGMLTDRLPARDRMRAQTQALAGWAKVDPFAAWDAARPVIEANPNGVWRISGVLRELARVDFSRAVNEALTLSTDRARSSARFAIISAAADDDRLETAFVAAQAIGDAVERAASMSVVFQRWGATDLDAPLQAMRSIGDQNLTRSAMAGFLTGWVESDPNGAVEYALAHHNETLVEGAFGRVLGGAVGQLSTAEARAMMSAVMEAGALDSVAQQVVFPMTQFHPELAVSLISSVSREEDRRRYLSTALSMWSRNDFSAAASYFEQMPYDSGKRSVFVNMSQRALETDGGAERVVRWLDSFPEVDRRNSVTNLLSMLERNPVRLRPDAAGVLASAVAITPGLPDEARARAQRLFGAATVSP